MWPGQQPPGGEQNPQDQNPYQQPGYQQPNPYQQPGYPQQGQPGQQPGYPPPNPYQQPTVPQYAVPGGPGGPGGPKPDDKKKTTMVAIVAATAVVVTAVVTGVVVMNKDDGPSGSSNVADGKNASPSAKPSTTPSDTPSSPATNPRGGQEAEATIPGWKVVTNPKWGTRFDVPGDWEVSGSGVFSGFENEKKGDGSIAVGFSSPANYKSKWCVDDADKDGTKEDTGLAGVGTKGAQGAKSADEAATTEATNWVWAAYAQSDPKEKVKNTKARPYTTTSGLSGSVVTATATGLAKKDKCDTDGKSIAFTFKNGKDVFSSWVLYANAGIDDELPDATIQKILSTVRLTETPAS